MITHLEVLRVLSCLSQQELARLANIGRYGVDISLAESFKKQLSNDMLFCLTQALGVPLMPPERLLTPVDTNRLKAFIEHL